MKRIILSVIAPLAFTFAAACGGDSTVDKLGKLAGEMCGCKDAACAEQVDAKITDLKKTASKPADSERAKVEELSMKIQKCYMDAQFSK